MNNETIADIVREMRGHAKDGEFVNGYEVARLADRIEAAISPSLPAVCVNCRNYDARRQYCPTIDSTICKGVAKELKARGCDKWVAK